MLKGVIGDPLGTVNPDIAQFSRSTGSGKCLQMAKRWLEKCLTSHASCGQWSGQSLPTRLLDVGDSTGSDTIRLALADEVPDGSPYLTLSYCWGKTKPVVLKNALVATFRKAITIPALPKTIQDAIDITRKLGYQFLWVDSLCIIQDSHDDWEQEAKKMDRVYLDSTLTIAATASASNEGGCFRDREPLSYLPCRISGTQQNGLYVCRSRFSRTVHKIQERFIDTAPLNTRAWVLQERILSRRILHFTDNTLYWDCSVLQATDSCPDGYRVSNNILQPNRNLRWRLRNLMGPDPKTERGSFYLDKTLNLVRRAFPSFETPAMWDTERTFYHDWQTIVRMYSSCHLTVRSDKKVALGGIVQWLQRGRSFQYAEGFWYRNTLAPQQLLWASDATEPLARPEFRGAPSWSWLSVDGPIKFAIATPTESDIRDQLFEWSSEWIARSTVSILDNTEPGSTTIHNNTRALCLDAKLLRINLATWRHFRADCKFAPSHTSPVFAAFLVERVSAYAQLLVGDTNTRPSCTKGFAGLILVRSENDDTFTRVGMFKFDPLEMWAHKTSTLEAREFRVMADLERVVDSLEVSAVHIV